MKHKKNTPVIGTTCPALTNENYDYHFSGDAAKYCQCALTDNLCKGITIKDPEDRSSRFFSRGKCVVNQKKLEKCPLYGITKETFGAVLKDKMQKQLAQKLAGINSSK